MTTQQIPVVNNAVPGKPASESLTLQSINNALVNKVDKVEGKVLSTNDYTNTEKDKLSSLSASNVTLSRTIAVTTSIFSELVPDNCYQITLNNTGSGAVNYALGSTISNAEFASKASLSAGQSVVLNTTYLKALALLTASGSTSVQITGISKL